MRAATLSLGLYLFALLLDESAGAQSLCPHPLTLREAPGTPGLSQSPGSGLGGRITRQEWDANWLNVEAICGGDIRSEDWGTALADGCLLEAAGGALVCGAGGGGGGATDFSQLTGDLALDQTDGTCGGAGEEILAWTAGVPACIAVPSGGGGGVSIEDADGDTRVTTEKTPDQDWVVFDVSGVESFSIRPYGIISHKSMWNGGSGPLIAFDAVATCTGPTLFPQLNDSDTGIGHCTGTGELSLVSDGVEMERFGGLRAPPSSSAEACTDGERRLADDGCFYWCAQEAHPTDKWRRLCGSSF